MINDRDNTDNKNNHGKIADLKIRRIKNNVFNETDPDYREEVEDFMNKYKNDTLTGL